MSSPVVHFEILGNDGAALADFYEQLFGWKMQAVPEMGYNLVEKEDGGIGGGIGATQGDGPGHVTFYVQVEDPQAALDRAEELGGITLMAPTAVPNMVTFALFADPEGHVVGVVGSETPE